MLAQQKPVFYSQKSFYEMTMLRQTALFGLGYLLLREMPIRNFYARSVVWGLVGLKLYQKYQIDLWKGGFQSTFAMDMPDGY